MLDVKGEGGIDVCLLIVECFAREAVHQIDADVMETSLTERVDGGYGLLGCMTTMEEL